MLEKRTQEMATYRCRGIFHSSFLLLTIIVNINDVTSFSPVTKRCLTTVCNPTSRTVLSNNKNSNEVDSTDVVLKSTSRRDALQAIGLVSAIYTPLPAYADSVEVIRKAAANIPGYGAPDIYYPSLFAGKWRVTRSFPDAWGEGTLVYEMRFTDKEGGNQGVISDRGYNRQSYVNAAYQAGVLELMDGAITTPQKIDSSLLRSVEWVDSNPNVLTTSFVDGSSQEIKVTKRSFDISQETGVLTTSEYRRIADVGPRGIPSLSGSRVLTKWRWNEQGDIIEGIELVYVDGMGDPMSSGGKPAAGGGASKSYIKSRITLQKLS